MTITLVTDTSPNETSFEVHDLNTKNVLFSISGANLPPSSQITYTFCAPKNHCLKADLYDAAGNGGSKFSISFLSQSYNSEPGSNSFGHIATALIGATSCTDLGQVLDSAAYFILSAGKLIIGNGNNFQGSILGNPNSGEICLGLENKVTGWIRGDQIALGDNNKISGYHHVQLFGNDYGVTCQTSSGLGQNEFHAAPSPIGNTSDACRIDWISDPAGKRLNVILKGEGEEMVIKPGVYGSVKISNGAQLYYLGNADATPAKYFIEELIIDNASMTPGGVLCDIFMYANKLSIENGAYVEANINCELIHIGDYNTVKGIFEANDATKPFVIGNYNSLSDPLCPACGNSNKRPGLGRIAPEQQLKIWPNPSIWGEIHLACPSGKLEVYNLQGKMVHSANLKVVSGKNKGFYHMSTEKMNPGMYISRVITANGQVLTGKFLLLGS